MIRMKNSNEVGPYSEEVFRREFEKAIKDGHVYGSPFKKGKRFRSAFTTEQVNYLEKEFRKYPYIGTARRKDVSNVLNIPERAVKIWFQNRRMKEKKDSTKDVEDKSMESTSKYNQIHNMVDIVQPNSGTSLPNLSSGDITVLHEPERSVINVNKDAMDANVQQITNTANFYRDMSGEPERDETRVSKLINTNFITPQPNTTVIKNKRYKIEAISDEEDVNVVQGKSTTDLIYNPPIVNRADQFSFGTFTPPSVSPHDLSSKTNIQQEKTVCPKPSQPKAKPDVKPAELPLYLKGFYAQPYIPPGNMIWKPINVSPIMSSPIPALAVPTVNGQSMKRGCNCDCHIMKPVTAPNPAPLYFHQNNPNPNLQYVITAVPFQNPSPKY